MDSVKLVNQFTSPVVPHRSGQPRNSGDLLKADLRDIDAQFDKLENDGPQSGILVDSFLPNQAVLQAKKLTEFVGN